MSVHLVGVGDHDYLLDLVENDCRCLGQEESWRVVCG